HLRSLDLKQSTTDARGGRGLVGRRRAGVYDPKRMPNHQHHFNLNLCFPYQYIVLLFSLFLVQFSVACACLALSTEDQRSIVSAAWAKSPVEAKIDMMRGLQCCGFRRRDLPASDSMSHPPCKLAELSCCKGMAGRNATCCQGSDNPLLTNSVSTTCPCTTTCWSVVEQKLERGTRLTGTVSLLFSVVEV
ncbi:putative transmembrane 4 superfamily member, partial [Fasciolopsis buskii]